MCEMIGICTEHPCAREEDGERARVTSASMSDELNSTTTPTEFANRPQDHVTVTEP
jgi:hypothetical protein